MAAAVERTREAVMVFAAMVVVAEEDYGCSFVGSFRLTAEEDSKKII